MNRFFRVPAWILTRCCLISILSASCNAQVLGIESDDFNQIFDSAMAGNKQRLQQIIQERGSLDFVDRRGRSAVLMVTMQNNMTALQLLIELGANVDYYDETKSTDVIDQTAFLFAGAKGMNAALDLLIKANAKTDIYNYYGGTALIPAAEKGHVETVKLLLQKSSDDVNHVNNLGWTALMEAVILSDGGIAHQQIVTQLLAYGADPDIRDNEGVSVLEHARNRQYTAIIDILTKP